MVDLLRRSLPMFLAPTPIIKLGQYQVRLQRRGGSNLWGLCRKTSVGASGLELIYSTERSDGSVVFRFGTASEIEEYVASQESLNVNGRVVTEDVGLTVSDDSEDTMEGFTVGLEMDLPAEDLENVLECTSDSSEIMIGGQISSEFDGVPDAACADRISTVLVEEPSIHEDKDVSSETETLAVAEDSVSFENNFESGFVEELSTFENTSGSDGHLEKENVNSESSSVIDEDSEFILENMNMDSSSSSSANDVGGNVGKDAMYLENSSASDENFKGDLDKESVVFKNIISDEDSDGGDQSTILKDTIIVYDDLDHISSELDTHMMDSPPLKEALHYIGEENICSPSVVSDANINANDETSNHSEIYNVPVAETTDVSGYYSDSNGDIEMSIIEQAGISDDEEVAVVDGTLTSDEEVARDSDPEYVVLQKTSLSEVIQNEDAQDFSSLLVNSLDASVSPISVAHAKFFVSEDDNYHNNDEPKLIKVDTVDIATSSTDVEETEMSDSVAAIPVATQLESELSVDEKIDFDVEEAFLSTTGIDCSSTTVEKATSTTEATEVDILSSSATATLISEATEWTRSQLVADREQALPVRFCLSMGAALLPQITEALSGGEDAYFISGEAWFGVADGVGQWSLEGIDDGLYAHELMENCRRIVSNGCFPPSTNPREVLSRSAAEATLPGSATALVAYFDGQVLHASNIGDTGFIIVRNGVVLSRSSPTIHGFHFPYQIQKGDDPLEFVECYEIELSEGDVIVAATNGLFDNLYAQEIASIVTESLRANLSPKEVAAVLAVKAQEIGQSTSTRSPFADAAQSAGYTSYTGGKLDDVAVIVSFVQKKS